VPATADTDGLAAARTALEQNPVWYHTLELAPGVLTPGEVDQRGLASKLLPDDLSGLRALDIGTFDGFWAFEMERRGAEVVATDVEKLDAADWPPTNRERLVRDSEELAIDLGRGFKLAKEALGSNVERHVCNVYDLSPERIGGAVDFIFMGALLLHLRDPVAALERARETLRDGGRMLIWEPISLLDSIRSPRRPLARLSPLISNFTWWLPNYAGLVTMALAAGFRDVNRVKVHRVRGPRIRNWCCALEARP
jgi:SAM-dependent methyltransferase